MRTHPPIEFKLFLGRNNLNLGLYKYSKSLILIN